METKKEIVVVPVNAEIHHVHKESKTSATVEGSVFGSKVSFFVQNDSIVDRDEDLSRQRSKWCCWR
jgi:hypothetical protein